MFFFPFHSNAFVALFIVRVCQNATSSIRWYMCDTVPSLRVWSLLNQKWDQGQKLLQNNNAIWMNEWMKTSAPFSTAPTTIKPEEPIECNSFGRQIWINRSFFLLSFRSCFRTTISIESMNKIETIVPTFGSDPNVWPRNREKVSIFIWKWFQ